MIYDFVMPNGKLVEHSSGCWGACGRLDNYPPRSDKIRGVLRDFVDSAGMDMPSVHSGSYSGYFVESPSFVRLSLKDPAFGELFHISNYEIMEYFVERSPFRVLFSHPWKEYYEKNYLDVDCSTVPSQITMVALIWLRDCISCQVNVNRTFTLLLEAGIPEGLAFITAKENPSLCNGTGRSGYAGHEASGMVSMEFWLEPEPTIQTWDDYYNVFHMSCSDIGGYPLILCEFWDYPKKQVTEPKFESAYSRTHSSSKIKGIFGEMSFVGITDPIKFTKLAWGLK